MIPLANQKKKMFVSQNTLFLVVMIIRKVMVILYWYMKVILRQFLNLVICYPIKLFCNQTILVLSNLTMTLLRWDPVCFQKMNYL